MSHQKTFDFENEKRMALLFGNEEALRKIEELEQDIKDRTERILRLFGLE